MEGLALDSKAHSLTTPLHRISQITKAIQVSLAKLSGKYTRDTGSGKAPQAQIYAMEPT